MELKDIPIKEWYDFKIKSPNVRKCLSKTIEERNLLLRAIREAYEVWAGSEEVELETYAEKYLDGLIKEIRNILTKAIEESCK